jgi:hypothetical protein
MRAANVPRWSHGSRPICTVALAIVGLALAAGVAPAHAQQEAAPDLDLQRLESGGTIDLSYLATSRSAVVDTVPAPIDSVWRDLPKAYEALGISEVRQAPGSWMVGNTGFNVRHHLGKRRVSRYLNCGYGQTGPMADDAIVHVGILTQLSSAGDGRTVVRSAVSATATPTSISGGPARCQTTGRLESAIADALERAARGG